MRVPARFKVVFRWILGLVEAGTTPVPAAEIAKCLFGAPDRVGGQRFIERVEEDGATQGFHLRGVEFPLWWPREMGRDALHLILNEQFDHSHWHRYETEETPVLPGDTVIDCGAAEGLFSLLVAKRCQKVYAIEPLPSFVATLGRTLAPFKNVEILPCLLGRKTGSTRLRIAGIASSQDASGETEVEVATLDDRFHDRGIKVDYLKADLEGAEMDVLEGGRRLIAEQHPRIAITTYHRGDHVRQISSLLHELNPAYRFKTRGLTEYGAPILLHAWTPS